MNIPKPVQLKPMFSVLALFWASLTFWLSASPDAQGAAGFLDLTPPWDKLYHASNFGVLAALLYLATGRVWLAASLASLYGVLDEVHQAFVPGRSSDAGDWLADTTGALIAVLLFAWLRRRARAR